jgi:RNA polymerase sigma factor (sigma-70 family)
MVLLRVARRMETFRYDPARSFRAWLKTVTRTAWSDWLESQCRPGQGSGDSAVLDRLGSIEARDELLKQLEDEYDLELLEFATLRVRLRIEPHTWEAFRLQAYEGLSAAEAASRLAMRLGAVYVAKSKVLKMLQEEIRRSDGGE